MGSIFSKFVQMVEETGRSTREWPKKEKGGRLKHYKYSYAPVDR